MGAMGSFDIMCSVRTLFQILLVVGAGVRACVREADT